ncbi:MAG: sodium-dependent transporter [Clostridia bacterium]|nr:sodium-dependent transporter [Clostridia bacterium]
MATEKFSSKTGFILASVGAAVGLGNALRFPGLCAKYGGGTYLFIYIIALLVLGIPMLNAEIALGRKFGGGAPKCMESLVKGGAKLGWAACLNSLITAIIYAGLAGWIIATIVNIVPLCMGSADMSKTEISGHFFKNVLNARNDGVISSISPTVCAGIAVAFAAMFLCLRGGADTLSKAAKFTVIIPVVLLAFMAGRGLIYENSGTALSALFTPDFSKLASPELWLSALGQVFFSMSVGVGIMPAYGAYLPEGTNIFKCSLIIAAADFAVSVLASVVLFTTLYGCGLQAEIGQSGIITAFAVYPVAITKLFGATAWLNAVAGVLFYASLAMIAIQAAVSMAEAFLAPLSESFGIKKARLAGLICIIGAGICLIFATSAAVVLVDVSDRFVNFYNVLLLAIAESLILGWSGQINGVCTEINRFTKKLKMPEKPFKISVKLLCPAVLISLSAYEAVRLIINGLDFPLWIQAGFGWGLSLLVFACSLLIGKLAKARSIPRALIRA